MTTTNTNQEQSPQKASVARKTATVIGICLVAWGLWEVASLFIDYKRSETTDDAQVEQYLSPVNIRVPGYIKRICFTEHQYVHKGDTLLILEDDEYRIQLKQAEAALMDARSGRKVVSHTLNTAANSASAYDASIAEAQYRVEQLEKDYRRYSALLEKGASTPIMVEQYQTQLEMARARVNALEQQRNAARSSVDGYLGRRSIEEGQLVSAGQTLTTLISDMQKWIVANYKETQIASLSVGQEVEVTVDAFKGKRFKGRITAISSATGSKYSLVPTDNSAGNFVKIQQRVPVRIDLVDLSKADNARLAAGMMCIVKSK